MKKDAFSVAATALEVNTEDSAVSRHIKSYFDQKYGHTWHCFVGSDFKAFVSHENKHFIYFYIGKSAICLFKTA